MKVLPIEFRTASKFVNEHHRHHDSPIGHKFSFGLYVDGWLVGVAIIGRPVSRHLDNGETLEVTRLCVKEGIKNGCSKLYAKCIWYAKKNGYTNVITYTFMSENGASLKASNFKLDMENAGGLKWTGERKHISTELKKRWKYVI